MRPIYAILITYHPSGRVPDAVRAAAEQADHVIVVDNSATESARNLLTQAFAPCADRFTLIFNPANLGVAAALNIGMRAARAARAHWVLTLDQDSRLTSGMVAALASAWDAMPREQRTQIGVLAPQTVSADEESSGNAPAPSAAWLEVETAITSGCLVCLEAWQAVGGFNEALFIDYVDHEFCFRLRREGWRIAQCPDARLVHTIGNADRRRFFGREVTVNQHPPVRSYYIARNGLFFWRAFPGPSAFIRADKRNTLTLLLKALTVEPRKGERLKMFWRGYRDYRAGRSGA
ncbi:MAG: glycosyltransferase family 2 protein, partial [Kiritimatiellia bacterium]|nr:glycosyltransferase family 2 protein [Kiritimatiellia bacterium]